MTREDLEYEIEYKCLLLKFTKKAIKDPPVDQISKDMIAQADRIQDEIDNMLVKLKELPLAPKPEKKRTVRKKTKTKIKRRKQ